MNTGIKSFLHSERALFMLVVFSVGVIAYGLGVEAGKSSVDTQSTQAAVILTPAPEMTIDDDAVPVVASRSGTKYHRLDCPGASTIKEANLVRFASIDLARAAGYLPAGNCKGLK